MRSSIFDFWTDIDDEDKYNADEDNDGDESLSNLKKGLSHAFDVLLSKEKNCFVNAMDVRVSKVNNHNYAILLRQLSRWVFKRRSASIAYMESTVDWHFYSSSLFQICFIVIVTFLLYSKTPQTSLF